MEPMVLVIMKTGERLITQARGYIPEAETLDMIAPMEIIVRTNPITMETVFGLGEWMPRRFSKDDIKIKSSDVLSIINPTEKLVAYYQSVLKALEEVPIQQTRLGAEAEHDMELPGMPNANNLTELLENLPIKRTLH